MSLGKIIKNGVISENPVFVKVVALCPLLAVTSTVFSGIGMGVAVILVMITTNVMISLLRPIIPEMVRIPCLIVIIAAVVSILQLYVRAYFPAVHSVLGIFLPLIAVNCIILSRGESFALKNNPLRSAVDGFAAGLGFALALVVLAAVREILGFGTLFAGFPFVITLPEAFPRTVAFTLAPGAFITLGFVMAGFKLMIKLRKRRERNICS